MPVVKYVNHNNEEAILHGDMINFMNLNVLRGYKWDYSTTNRPNGMGGSASSFSHKPLKKSVSFSTHTSTLEELHAIQNGLLAVTEPDVIDKVEGKLYVGDQYISCYIVAAEPSDYNICGHYSKIDLTLLITKPFWCSENTTIFNKDSAQTQGTTSKRFPYTFTAGLGYGYRYTTDFSNFKLNNTHYAECPMIITVYGYANSPSIAIAGNTYAVDVQVPTGSRLVIDQTNNTINIVNSGGVKTSVFNSRNKAYNIFKPLPPGVSQVIHSGDYKFAITVVQQRSGMKWTR